MGLSFAPDVPGQGEGVREGGAKFTGLKFWARWRAGGARGRIVLRKIRLEVFLANGKVGAGFSGVVPLCEKIPGFNLTN
jgi:hypothetical protein